MSEATSLPELKREPLFGYYPWWPEDGDSWLHPEDVELARTLIPSPRIFRREGESGPYVLVNYGEVRLRVRRTLWREVTPEGFLIGDRVEIRTRGMANEARTGVIREMLWDEHAGEIRYQVAEQDHLVPKLYNGDDLKPVEIPALRDEVRIEPTPE